MTAVVLQRECGLNVRVDRPVEQVNEYIEVTSSKYVC